MTNLVISFKPSSMNMAAHDTLSSNQPLSKLFKSSTKTPSFTLNSSFAPKTKFPEVPATQYHYDLPPKLVKLQRQGRRNQLISITIREIPCTDATRTNYLARSHWFFSHLEADNPSGPLREATDRNSVIFSQDWKLKFSNPNTLEKVYKMQVAMIPYKAWPVCVTFEMEEDFLAVRRNFHKQSLD